MRHKTLFYFCNYARAKLSNQHHQLFGFNPELLSGEFFKKFFQFHLFFIFFLNGLWHTGVKPVLHYFDTRTPSTLGSLKDEKENPPCLTQLKPASLHAMFST